MELKTHEITCRVCGDKFTVSDAVYQSSIGDPERIPCSKHWDMPEHIKRLD